jgi:DNA-binding NtrC family response regulator
MTGHVLLFEDDLQLNELLRDALGERGLDVVSCPSLPELYTAIVDQRGDLAVVDCWSRTYQTLLPHDRAEIVQLAEAIPTIMITARTWAKSVSAQELGLLALLEKPFDLEQLCGTVQEQMQFLKTRSQATRQHAAHLTQWSNEARARLQAARERLGDSRE